MAYPHGMTREAARRALLERWRKGDHALLPDIRPRPDPARPVPLTRAQERIWIVGQLHPDLPLHTLTFGTRARFAVDHDRLRDCLDELVRRHEALRATVALTAAGVEQTIRPAEPVDLPLRDLAGLAPGPRQAEVERITRREAATPLDLATGPLLRASHLRLADDDHVILLSAHHVVVDGRACGVLARELWQLYEARSRGAAGPPPPALQFPDFAAWEAERRDDGAVEAGVRHWVKRLADVPALELPTDRPRPATRTNEGGTVPVHLPADLVARLRELARERRASLSMLLLAAYATLLGRVSGQDDLAIGMTMPGRYRGDLDDVVGCFVNTLPLRLDMSGRPAFSELLDRVRGVVADGLAHQSVPLQQVVEALRPDRDLSRPPVFQVAFNLRLDEARGLAEYCGGRVEALPRTHSGIAEFELMLELVDAGETVSGYLEYGSAIFTAETAAGLAAGLAALLRSAVADPGRPIARLDVLGAVGRERIAAWETGGEARWPARTVTRCFEAQVGRSPDAVALRCPDRDWTYAELNGRANRLAHHLRALGAGPGTTIGIGLSRSAEQVVAVLGVLKAGAAYVPLDPGHPAARLEAMVRDSGLSLLLGEPAPWAAGRPALPPGWEPPAGTPDGDPDWTVDGRDVAYVIYTSGSTGTPKGVAAEHRSILNPVLWTAERYGFGPGDRMVLKTPVGFDASTWELFSPLVTGGSLVVTEPGAESDPARLCQAIAAGGATAVQLVPSMLRAVLAEPGLAGCRTLRRVFSGGEALSPEVAGRLRQVLPGIELHNLYGPTEASVHCLTWPCPDPAPERIPIGRPLANMAVRVLDRELERVPPGVPGEIFLTGAGLARGYWSNPAATSERFLPDPHAGRPSQRLYRTGDVGRFLADGSVEYLGRADQQVKVRGCRIELAEVEAGLLAEPDVEHAVVVGDETAAGTRLVAYVVAPAEHAPTAESLRRAARERLPDFMVPGAFVVLERLPLTPSGKLDRRALPKASEEAILRPPHVEPGTELERELAAIWREVLGVEAIGLDDDFFDLGGHSLLATRLVARVRGRLGVELGLRELFEAPVLRRLAARLADRAAAPEAARPRPRARDRALPLSFAQQRLWFLDQLEPGSPLYVIGACWRLVGELDEPALRAGLDEVVSRHEALRTAFATVDGRPVLAIAAAPPLDVETADLTATGEPGLAAAIRAEGRRPFDLAAGPPLRWRLYRLEQREHVLLLVVHHAVFDQISGENVGRELAELYRARLEGRAPALPVLAIQYADYAAWQRERLEGPGLEREIVYWRERLAGCPGLEVPGDRPRPPVPSHRGANVALDLAGVDGAALDRVCRAHRVTRFMALLAAFQVLLSRRAGQTDVVLGTPVSGRGLEELESMVGFVVNTLVLRTDLAGEPTFADALDRVRRTVLDSHAHQELPFDRLVDALQVPRDLSRTPLFQVMFTFTETAPATWAAPGLEMRPVRLEPQSARFDLSLDLALEGGRLAGTLEYATDLYEPATAARLAGEFATLLAAAVERPELPVSRLQLMTERERERVLVDWNLSDVPYPAGTTIVDLFEAQVARTPDAPAVVCEGALLTYRELDARANSLAHRLRELGAGPESVVAVFLDRSPELLVALYGTLKAGAAYLPLDPGYPPGRLRFMLEDSRAAVLLTRAGDGSEPPPFAGPALALDVREPLVERPAPARAAGPQHLAYVIYTSGSTGVPKGVMNGHAGLFNRLMWMQGAYRLGPADAVFQKTPSSFDVSVWEFFWPLLFGARLVVARPGGHRDAGYLASVIEQERVTILHFVPSMLEAFLELPDLSGCGSLRLVVCSGEELKPGQAARCHERLDARLANLYGPTEAAIDVSAWECRRGARLHRVPIGRPIANIRLHVLDRWAEPVPPGVAGELHIAGVGLARGYLGRPALTAERFVPDPHGAPGSRLYRTGDVARYRPDSSLEYLGRQDGQVKIRGFRIELGEIEARLREHPSVAAAAVVARAGEAGDRRLVAYVVPAAAGAPSPVELRRHLGARLPEHMVPAVFAELEALPLSPNGKLDRRALPDPGGQRPELEVAYEAPRDERESALAGIWAEVLGVDRVGVRDGFFALGGDSILSIQVVARARRAGLALTPRQLFQHQTVAELAAVAGAVAESGPAPAEADDEPEAAFPESGLSEPELEALLATLEVER